MNTFQPPNDEFYIGYSGEMPRGIGRRVRLAVTAMAAVGAVSVLVVVAAQMPLPPSRFEFGVMTERTGILKRMPYPTLDVGNSRVLLVGRGKWSADRQLSNIDDGPVTIRGSRIQRGSREMLEVHDARQMTSSAVNGHPRTRETSTIAKPVTLRGEIVDSKCFLGVMNPGEGAVHRDCARRCVSGGIPPMLVVRDGRVLEELIVLLSADGGPIGREIIQAIGEPVEVSGLLVRGSEGYALRVSSWK
jgi:hypothetical protein